MDNKKQAKPKKDVICHCSGTTESKIKALIGGGCATLDEISRATGACSGCGACDYSIMELIAADNDRKAG